MRVIWAPRAIARAAEIAQYIAADRPGAAAAWVEQVFAKAATLGRHAGRGRRVPEVDRDEIRQVLHGKVVALPRRVVGIAERPLAQALRHVAPHERHHEERDEEDPGQGPQPFVDLRGMGRQIGPQGAPRAATGERDGPLHVRDGPLPGPAQHVGELAEADGQEKRDDGHVQPATKGRADEPADVRRRESPTEHGPEQ